MSATLDGDLLSRYFDGAPSLKVPGRTFPVTALFLEDALEITKHTVDRFAEWAARVRSGNLRYTGRSSYSGGQSQTVELESSRIEDLSPHAVKERYFRYSGSVQSALAALDPDAVNYELAAQLVTHFLTQPVPEGPRGQKLPAILVFLSGAREIQKMRSALFSVSPNLAKEPMCSWILVLHSSLSPEEQRRVFEHPPPKARKAPGAGQHAFAKLVDHRFLFCMLHQSRFPLAVTCFAFRSKRWSTKEVEHQSSSVAAARHSCSGRAVEFCCGDQS
mmetsp:Transcript_29711/g.98459  ORF Transcript_29711/g.98459 Transcript_29711/m.98459 type:complete len:275 (-) Transcript_29711:1977-2801(-)